MINKEEFFKSKFVINCRTEKDAIELFKELGDSVKWCTKECIDIENNYWREYKSNMCYRFGSSGLTYGDIDCYLEDYDVVEYIKNPLLVNFQ